MKNLKTVTFVVILLVFMNANLLSQTLLSPYLTGSKNTAIQEISLQITQALKTGKFEITGNYNPAKNTNYQVITFTNEKLKEIVYQTPYYCYPAMVLKIALVSEGASTQIILLNPEYLFNAFVANEITAEKLTELMQVSKDVLTVLKTIGIQLTKSGGELDSKVVQNFSYRPGSPDYKTLNEIAVFNSFQEALSTINQNLESRKSENIKVYEITNTTSKVAIIGVGMFHVTKGENNFISNINNNIIATLPFEIIIADNKVFLHDKAFRIPLFFPELQQVNFPNTMRNTKFIEEQLLIITQKE